MVWNHRRPDICTGRAVEDSMTPTSGFRPLLLMLLLVALVAAPGCAAIAGIFKAGVWVGVVMAVVVIAIVLFLVSRIAR